MELLSLIKLGTPALILGMLLFLERIHSIINVIRDDVSEIKKGITWKDTCNERHEDVDRRLSNLERVPGFNGN